MHPNLVNTIHIVHPYVLRGRNSSKLIRNGLTSDRFPGHALRCRLWNHLSWSGGGLKLHWRALDVRVHGARSYRAVASLTDCAS